MVHWGLVEGYSGFFVCEKFSEGGLSHFAAFTDLHGWPLVEVLLGGSESNAEALRDLLRC